jgi:diguanylate cyclase (GGDEF)-like protein
MPKFIFSWMDSPVFLGYVIAVLSVAIVTIVAWWPGLNLRTAPVSLLFCAVMLSAGFGGIKAGALAIALSMLVFDYYFVPPIYSLEIEASQLPRFFIFSLSVTFVGALTAAQRSTAQSLRRTRDGLEKAVQQLKKSNTALQEEIAERKRAEEHADYLAHYDTLTGLPNRALLQDRMKQAIAYAHRNRTQVAILSLDIDHFKHINESLGHSIGDLLLQLIANRLQECLREGDSVARVGADEFVLILPLINSKDAVSVAQKTLDTLNRNFLVEGHELHLTASIGISLYPDDGNDVESMMRTGYTAMNHAKEKGRNNYQFFTAALNVAAQRRLDLANHLRQAFVHGEFELYYQPQVNMESGTTFAAEALLRWKQPGNAPLSCGAFISTAEDTGLILPMGEWALRQACKQLKHWHDLGHRDLRIEVNLSPRQFSQQNLRNLVKRVLEETGLPAVALGLEITEGVLLQDSEDNMMTLKQLSGLGIQLSVDDFGTGYSSLAYLQRFPVHALKIDQSFVRGIGKNPNDTALVTAIIAMAHGLHLKVLAEGVETPEQVAFLLSRGCLAAQGFYYSEALPADEFIKQLDKQYGHNLQPNSAASHIEQHFPGK